MYVMGKRKRRADLNKISPLPPPPPPPGPAFMPYSSRMDSISKEKSSHLVGTSSVKPMSSLKDIIESPVKQPSAHHSTAHRHHNVSRALLLRLPRHSYSLQYSQRNSANHAGTANSHGKSTPLHDEKLYLKLAHKSESDSGRHAERREKASRKQDRIRSSSLALDVVSSDVLKMVCGLCQKLLKRRPYILESTISSSDLSVVAVLVCGHVYHADCLETRTCYGDRTDPPCPLCMSPAVGT